MKQGKSTAAGKSQPVKGTGNDIRKLEGKPPVKTPQK